MPLIPVPLLRWGPGSQLREARPMGLQLAKVFDLTGASHGVAFITELDRG